jgi:hypothetical protein
MKLSDRTLSVLKNFASINAGVLLKQGSLQKTISSPSKSILVEAILDDDLPVDFGIYDLNQFLGIVTTLTDPELQFGENEVSLSDSNFTFTYRACPANLIVFPPDKELVLKSIDVSFELNNNILTKLLKIAAMTSLPHLSVLGRGGELLLQAHERTNDTSNLGWTKLGEYTGKDFIATFKTENLKLLPDDYDVELQINAFAKFVNKAKNLKYFIALESGTGK